MKKYLVIGNPIKHSLSPELHNYWIKQNHIDAIYEKKELNHNELENLILNIKKENMHGANITVPFKNAIIPHIDELSDEARKTQSVNTIYLQNKKVVGVDIGKARVAPPLLSDGLIHLPTKITLGLLQAGWAC